MNCPDDKTFHDYLARRISLDDIETLENHVFSCQTCIGMLEALASTSEPRANALARFEILELIGQGAMGVVLAARDPELERRVAIKILRTQIAPTEQAVAAQAQLVREARAMAKVTHPNVITVYEAGSADNEVFVVMECVDGGTLQQWLQRSARSWREIVRVFIAAGRGLAAAHKAGVVHRDFKPSNVLVSDEGRILVTDFGLAGTSAREATVDGAVEVEASTLTRAGAVVGTPAYMAPEQFAGAAIDDAADQFSFCVALYEALVGQRPFAGDTAESLLSNVRSGTLQRLPKQTRLPRAVRAVLYRGLRSKPSERYPSMRALLGALTRALRVRRQRIVAGAVAGVASLGIVAVLWATQPPPVCTTSDEQLAGVWDRARKQSIRSEFSPYKNGPATYDRVVNILDTYVSEWVAMRREACEATRLRGEQSERLMDLRMQCLERHRITLGALTERLSRGVDRMILDKAVASAQALPRLAECADAEAVSRSIPLPSDAAVREQIAELRAAHADARTLAKLGKYQQALARSTDNAETARRLGYAPVIGDVLALLGQMQNRAGNAEEAEATYKEAVSAATEARNDVLVARLRIALVRLIGVRVGRVKEADIWLTVAEDAIKRVPDNQALRAAHLLNLAALRGHQGKYRQSRELYEQALALREQILPKNTTGIAVARAHVGSGFYREGRYADAADQYQRALKEFEEALGPDHALIGSYSANHAAVLMGLSRNTDAQKAAERALAIMEHTVGPDHRDYGMALGILSRAYMGQGRYEDAQRISERALAIRQRNLGPEHSDIGEARQGLGMILVSREKYDEAQLQFETSLAIFEKLYGRKHPTVANALGNLGFLYGSKGEYAKAANYYSQSLSVQRELFGANSRQVLKTLLNIAKVHKRSKRPREACAIYDQAAELAKAKGQSPLVESTALLGRGECEREKGRFASAIELFERALEIRTKVALAPIRIAAIQFPLAETLWQSKRDRLRAIALMRTVHATALKMNAGGDALRDAAKGWLRKHARDDVDAGAAVR